MAKRSVDTAVEDNEAITRGTANVFADLGYANADLIAVVNRVSARNLTSFLHAGLYDRTSRDCCLSWNQSSKDMLPY